MKLLVFDAKRFDRNENEGRPMHGYFVKGISFSGNNVDSFDKFVDDRCLNGLVLAAKDVVEVSYGTYERNGETRVYIDSVISTGAKFEYEIYESR